MSKRWQKVEIGYLKRHVGDKSVEELAKRFHTDPAEVESKIAELGLQDSGGGSGREAEVVASFEKALEALYAKKWKQAEKLFAEVETETRQAELAARSRQLATVARERSQKEPEEVDPYLRAVYLKNRGDLDEALGLCQDEGRCRHDGRFAYLAASICAAREELETAAEHLSEAIRLEPRSRLHALRDPDFKPLRAAKEFGDLLGA
jgi:tetratricopeptide (TPR) repeat protein